jgi:hypothetical protein
MAEKTVDTVDEAEFDFTDEVWQAWLNEAGACLL